MKSLFLIVLLVLSTTLSYGSLTDEVVVTFEKKENLITGFSVFIPTPQNSSGELRAQFRNEDFDYISVNKSFSSNDKGSNLTFSLKKPYQEFSNSFVLEKFILKFTNGTSSHIMVNKIIQYSQLNRVFLGEDILIKNLSYDVESGDAEIIIQFISERRSQFVEFFIRDFLSGKILIQKQKPINIGVNKINFSLPSNLENFYIEVDSSKKIFEFSEVNNIALYPFEKKEFCGDRIDNNNNSVIDENCFSSCPSIDFVEKKWNVLECSKNNWESKTLDSVSNVFFSWVSNVTLKKVFTQKTRLEIISSVPLVINNAGGVESICSNKIFTKEFIVEEDDSVEIFLKSQKNSTLDIISTPIQ